MVVSPLRECTAFFNNNNFERNIALQCPNSSIALGESFTIRPWRLLPSNWTFPLHHVSWFPHRKSSGFQGFGSHTLQLMSFEQCFYHHKMLSNMSMFTVHTEWLAFLIKHDTMSCLFFAKVQSTYSTNTFTAETLAIKSDSCNCTVNRLHIIQLNRWSAVFKK